MAGGQDDKTTQRSARVHLLCRFRYSRQPPRKGGDNLGLLDPFHVQLADKPYRDSQDAYFSCTVKDCDDEPSYLRRNLASVIHGTKTLTSPSHVVDSGARQICSGPQPTDTAKEAPMPQRLTAESEILHSVMACV